MKYRQYYAYSMSTNRKVRLGRVLNFWFNVRRWLGMPISAARIQE